MSAPAIPVQNYKRNPHLKRVGQEIPFQREQVEEYIRCRDDVVYFLNNYFFITTIDRGKQIINLWDYQEDIINLIHQNRKTIVLSARQISKTTFALNFEISRFCLEFPSYYNKDPNYLKVLPGI